MELSVFYWRNRQGDKLVKMRDITLQPTFGSDCGGFMYRSYEYLDLQNKQIMYVRTYVGIVRDIYDVNWLIL